MKPRRHPLSYSRNLHGLVHVLASTCSALRGAGRSCCSLAQFVEGVGAVTAKTSVCFLSGHGLVGLRHVRVLESGGLNLDKEATGSCPCPCPCFCFCASASSCSCCSAW